MDYARRRIAKALGVPEELLKEEPKPKLLTRFQILKIEDSRAFITVEELARFSNAMDGLIRNASIGMARGRALDALGANIRICRGHSEDDESYRIRIIAVGLGIPEEVLKGPEVEKPKPKLLTRFQILKERMPNEIMIQDYIDTPPGFFVERGVHQKPPSHPVGLAFFLKFQYGCSEVEKPKPKLLTRFQILKKEN